MHPTQREGVTVLAEVDAGERWRLETPAAVTSGRPS